MPTSMEIVAHAMSDSAPYCRDCVVVVGGVAANAPSRAASVSASEAVVIHDSSDDCGVVVVDQPVPAPTSSM